MKSYLIKDAETLKRLVPHMKGQQSQDRVAAFARVWSAATRKNPEMAKRNMVRVIIGTSALVYRITNDNITSMGTANVVRCREFAKEMEEEK